MSLQDKIARAKAQFAEVEPVSEVVDFGGEPAEVSIALIDSDRWLDLTATHPPRKGSTADADVGYNCDTLAADYPVEAIRVDGEPVAEDEWREALSVLGGPSRSEISFLMYKQNHLLPAIRLAAAGKAFKG